ncbi:MAG TPA: cupredoxin domain-containing protein [Acidimicrobiales bacterium]|nr:cupredoxin domain-containing protein [Acidimicrobiales bacterium]
MKRLILAATLFAAAGLFTFAAPARAANADVHAAGKTFNDGGGCSTSPGEDTSIHAGDSVTWHNCDTVNHTVTSDDGTSFDEVLDANGSDLIITFNTPGVYPYHCKIHGPQMKGTITVTAGPATTTTASTTTTTVPATTTTKQPTTTTTTVATTTTTDNLGGFFDGSTTSSEPTTTVFTTETTRALGQGGDSGTSAGLVAALIVGLGAVGTAVALIIRRIRGGVPPS